MRELLVSDGTTGRRTADDGTVSPVPPGVLRSELNRLSPYHLLLDPCGLARPDLMFHAGEIGSTAESSSAVLAFRHADGYRGRILLEKVADLLMPQAIESPDREGKEDGSRRLTLNDFRDVRGRRIPHRIGFDGGGERVTMEIRSMELE